MASLHRLQHQADVSQPKFNSKKLAYLDELADIIGDIDFDKNAGGGRIVALTDVGMKLIVEMERLMSGLEELHDIFTRIQMQHNQRDRIVDLIHHAHGEIIKQLGDDEWRLYAPD